MSNDIKKTMVAYTKHNTMCHEVYVWNQITFHSRSYSHNPFLLVFKVFIKCILSFV